MEIILKEDIENLGLTNDIVKVKPGFARNFLIPRGKAILALPSEREKLQHYLAEQEAKEADVIANAKKVISSLKEVTLKIVTKVGTGDKLFGSINNANISEELEKLGVTIDRKYIKIPGNNIKRTGKYTAKVRLHRLVEHDYDFEILPEAEPKKAKAEVAPKAVKSEVSIQEENTEASAE